MKKTKFLALGLATLFMGATLFVACNKEEVTHRDITKEAKVQHIDLKSALQETDFTNVLKGYTLDNSNAKTTSELLPEETLELIGAKLGVSIKTDRVNKIEKDGITTYTFLVTREDTNSENDVFENLIIQIDAEQSPSISLLKYDKKTPVSVIDADAILNDSTTSKACNTYFFFFCPSPKHTTMPLCLYGQWSSVTICGGAGGGGSTGGPGGGLGSGAGGGGNSANPDQDPPKPVHTAPVKPLTPIQYVVKKLRLNTAQQKFLAANPDTKSSIYAHYFGDNGADNDINVFAEQEATIKNMINLAIETSSTFRINTDSALTSYQDTEEVRTILNNLTESVEQENQEIQENPDGTKVTKFVGRFNTIIPVSLNFHVKAVLDDVNTVVTNEYSLKSVNSFVTTTPPLLNWVQDSYGETYDSNVATVNLNGHFEIGLKILGIDLTFSQFHLVKLLSNMQTGEAIDMFVTLEE